MAGPFCISDGRLLSGAILMFFRLDAEAPACPLEAQEASGTAAITVIIARSISRRFIRTPEDKVNREGAKKEKTEEERENRKGRKKRNAKKDILKRLKMVLFLLCVSLRSFAVFSFSSFAPSLLRGLSLLLESL